MLVVEVFVKSTRGVASGLVFTETLLCVPSSARCHVVIMFFCLSTAENEAADGSSPVHEEQSDPSLDTTQNVSETEHYEQPAEGDEESEEDDKEEDEKEQKHKLDQSQEHDNNNKEVDPVQSEHQHETVLEEDEAQQEGETSRDLTEQEDTEQVDTFFSTMSHRYENATQEGHIL